MKIGPVESCTEKYKRKKWEKNGGRDEERGRGGGREKRREKMKRGNAEEEVDGIGFLSKRLRKTRKKKVETKKKRRHDTLQSGGVVDDVHPFSRWMCVFVHPNCPRFSSNPRIFSCHFGCSFSVHSPGGACGWVTG